MLRNFFRKVYASKLLTSILIVTYTLAVNVKHLPFTICVDLNIIGKGVILGVITVGIDLKDEVQDWLLKKIEK
ncbi:hypothetical protein COI51_15775 [Bacillus toyonensis]|nr:hypothetical protein COO05_25690 [Bacillus toyonensis]PEJ58074.1 hypothetical protein CN906_30235 [Bacillus toyonensis]PEM12827.1 hypothetical protein CN616_26095 [Bacillus toyonensis]PHF83792.1 hypothetical protein COI51_15775 [Bacillus toyonensis]